MPARQLAKPKIQTKPEHAQHCLYLCRCSFQARVRGCHRTMCTWCGQPQSGTTTHTLSLLCKPHRPETAPGKKRDGTDSDTDTHTCTPHSRKRILLAELLYSSLMSVQDYSSKSSDSFAPLSCRLLHSYPYPYSPCPLRRSLFPSTREKDQRRPPRTLKLNSLGCIITLEQV